MTTSNRHLTAQKLYEALLEQGRQAGAPMTWGDLGEFMRGIRNPNNTYIKALQFSSGERLPETFDVGDQFAWEASQNSAYLAVVQSDSARDD